MIDRDPGSKLRLAVQAGSLTSVQRLISTFSEAITSPDPITRLTPLALAVKSNQWEIFELLLESGAEEGTISKVGAFSITVG